MTKPTIRIHNLQSNEIIDREMTDEEFNQYQIEQADKQAREIQNELNKQAKLELLNRLGIAEEEVKLLLS